MMRRPFVSPMVLIVKLTASDGTGGDSFGWSVAIRDETIVAGDFSDDSFRGAAYVFRALIPCEEVQSFEARCSSGGQGNRLQARVVLTDASHDGGEVEISFDGVPDIIPITGRRAQTLVFQAASGDHAVELTDPPGCLPAQVVTCP